jgi:hypothetical protein
VSTDTNPPLDLKPYMPQATNVVQALPWQLGRTADQRRLARGRQATLANHVASLLASGWTVAEVRAGLADAPGVAAAPEAAAQERLWRSGLKRAKNFRQRRDTNITPA